MKKIMTLAAAITMAAGVLGAQNLNAQNLSAQNFDARGEGSKSWYVAGSLNAEVAAIIGFGDGAMGAWSAGVGVGIHKMLGDRFSLGLNLAFSHQSEYSSTGATTLNFAYFHRVAERFYLVPEVEAGVVFLLSPPVYAGFLGALSPLGFEYRPSDKIGLRLNIVSFSYAHFGGAGLFSASMRPSFSVCYRF